MLIPEILTKLAIEAAERGWVSDPVLRSAIRMLLRERLAQASRQQHYGASLAEAMRKLPVTTHTEAANEQHYEVPQAFFEHVLGPRLKYSACVFEDGDDLAAAEERTLALYCERGQLEDGMSVLDLGCGWGSLSLWIAEKYPNSRVLSVSNSHGQREGIMARARSLGLDNIEVLTGDIGRLEIDQRFDRAFSIEMFEHIRNWPLLLQRVSRWLENDGRFFLHYFCHREYGYLYEDEGAGDWMSRNFFSGGVMPSENLPNYFDDDFFVEERWRVSGRHYSRTLETWLEQLDAAGAKAKAALARPGASSNREFQKWRLFMLACSELFAYQEGKAWTVAHVRLAPRPRKAP